MESRTRTGCRPMAPPLEYYPNKDSGDIPGCRERNTSAHARGRWNDAQLSASGNVGFCGLSFIVGLSLFHQILRSLCQSCYVAGILCLICCSRPKEGPVSRQSVRRLWLGAGREIEMITVMGKLKDKTWSWDSSSSSSESSHMANV